MALNNNFIVGGKTVSPDDVQFEIDKLEAAIAEQNRVINQLSTDTSLSTIKFLRQQGDKANELIEAIAAELNLKDFDDADVLRQVKAERQAKECAMLAARERDSSLGEIAAQLGFEFNGDVGEIHRAIDQLKIHPNVSADFLPKLHEVLGLGNVFCENNIVSAIAELKQQNDSYLSAAYYESLDEAITNLKSCIERIAVHLGIEFTGDANKIYDAIARLKNESANAEEASKCVKNIALILGYEDDRFTYTEINTAIARLRCECRQANEKLVAIAAKFDISNSNINEIYTAIDYLKHKNESLKEANRNGNQLIGAIAHVLRQFKAERQAKECAMLAARERDASLDAIAGYLGFDRFDGELIPIYEAISALKQQNEISSRILSAIANALGYEYVESPQTRDTLLGAIADLKSVERNNGLNYRALVEISKQLGFEYFDNEQVTIKIQELQEKAAIADQLQSDLINTDRDELQSERNHYRVILDKLCDRLNVPDIEALEHIAKHQEIDLDFTSQHNDDLREKLAESQATSLKYMNRIVELEKEVRGQKQVIFCQEDDLQSRDDAERERLKALEDGVRSLEHSATIFRDTVFAFLNLQSSGDWSRDAEAASKAINDLCKELRSLKEAGYIHGELSETQDSDLRHDDSVDLGRYKIKFLENGEVVRAMLGEPFPDELKEVNDRLTTAELIQIIRSLLK